MTEVGHWQAIYGEVLLRIFRKCKTELSNMMVWKEKYLSAALFSLIFFVRIMCNKVFPFAVSAQLLKKGQTSQGTFLKEETGCKNLEIHGKLLL